MHPRNFSSHVTIRPPARPSSPRAHQYKITQSTGMATQMQRKVYFERNRVAARTFKEKKQQQSRVFSHVIFDVYTHLDNREKARASD